MTTLVPTRPALCVAALAFVMLAGGARAQTTQLSGLHDALHLSADQEDGWRRYVAIIRPDPTAQARHAAAARMMATLPTPRRVDLIDAEMDEDAQVVHRQGEAVKAFYAALTPDQQRTFDRQTAAAQASGAQTDGAAEGSTLRQPPPGQFPPRP